ncbi:hypothetical protein Bca52824_016366 [Brassica carinata]|uniref:Uncharacterized protein n=1 Tax=Brassica carinata TaxID=52824 RepID=A0A8X8B6B2_BRACI|nr:hypothetical protein Bca52824_016366 [Brassica carinata]
MNAPVGPPDEDVAFLMQVEAIEACYKRNSQSGGMVATSKDQDKSGEPLYEGSGANTESCEREKVNVCGDDMPVDNGENKEGNVEEGCRVNTASDNLPQQICIEQDTRTLCLAHMAADSGNNREANKVASTGDMESLVKFPNLFPKCADHQASASSSDLNPQAIPPAPRSLP